MTTKAERDAEDQRAAKEAHNRAVLRGEVEPGTGDQPDTDSGVNTSMAEPQNQGLAAMDTRPDEKKG